MATLIEQVITEVPRFADDFVEVLAGPKRFLSARDLNDSSTLRSALVFYVLALLAAYIFYLPFQPAGIDTGIYIAKLLIYSVFTTLALTSLLLLSWRIVGGRAPLRAYFVATLYLSAIGTVLFSLGALISKGLFQVYAPEHLAAFISFVDSAVIFDFRTLKSQPVMQLVHLSVFPWAMAAFFAFAEASFWTYIILFWGGYRKLNALSRRRSVLAFVVWLLLMQPFGLLAGLGARAMRLMIF